MRKRDAPASPTRRRTGRETRDEEGSADEIVIPRRRAEIPLHPLLHLAGQQARERREQDREPPLRVVEATVAALDLPDLFARGVVALHAPDGVAVLPRSEAVAHRAVRRRDRVAHFVDAAVPLDGRSRMLGPRQGALRPRRPGLGPRGHEDQAAVGRELGPVGAEGGRRQASMRWRELNANPLRRAGGAGVG